MIAQASLDLLPQLLGHDRRVLAFVNLAFVGDPPAPSVMIDLIEAKKVDDPVFTGLDECTRETADTCIQK